MEEPDKDILQQILDYHFHLDSDEQREKMRARIAGDAKVRALHESLGHTLKPLDCLSTAQPPAGLAGKTLKLIEQHEQASIMAQASARIAQTTNSYPVRSGGKKLSFLWALSNLRDLAVAAACILLFFMISQPGLHYARQLANKSECAANISRISQALFQYAQDFNGMLPSISSKQTDDWMRNNTRNVYLLVKMKYIKPDTFVCPGSSTKRPFLFDPDKLPALEDFPGRAYLSYSFRPLFGRHKLLTANPAGTVLLSDRNPMFVDFDINTHKWLDLDKDSDLLKVNSPNHCCRGQNILFGNGSVLFSTTRFIGLTRDDIYSIRNICRYTGCEMPSPDDNFTAP